MAAALTLGIRIDIDLTALISRQEHRTNGVTCGIKVVGYHFAGRPGQRFRYAGESFTIPRQGFVRVISLPRVSNYVVEGHRLPLEDGVSPLDGFSFRWITLPAEGPLSSAE